MLGLLTGFVEELRTAGVPVSMVEAIDAMEALRFVDLADRSSLREALRATMVKNSRHQAAFDVAFDVYFAVRRQPLRTEADEGAGGAPSQQQGAGGTSGADMDELLQSLFDALMGLDPSMMRESARSAVDRLAGMEPGRPVGGTYYLYRTLRQLDVDALQERLLQALLEVKVKNWTISAGAWSEKMPRNESSNSARRSVTRSAAAWSRIGATRLWPRRSASRWWRRSI